MDSSKSPVHGAAYNGHGCTLSPDLCPTVTECCVLGMSTAPTNSYGRTSAPVSAALSTSKGSPETRSQRVSRRRVRRCKSVASRMAPGRAIPSSGHVTNMSAGPEGVVHFYNGRGTAAIKEGKYALNWTLSCHRSNQVRGSVHPSLPLRRLLPRAVKHWSLRSLQA